MRHRATIAALLLPTVAVAQPAPLPRMCTVEHVAEAGEPAPCTGVLMPPGDALDGAACLDAGLPRCKALRRRAAAVCAADVAQLARQVSEADARAERWRELARMPCPPAVTRRVEVPRGLPSWVTWAAAGVALVGGVWVGWRLRGLASP